MAVTNLITSEDQLREYFPANLALDFDTVAPYLRRVQDRELRETIGGALLTRMRLDDIGSDKLGEFLELARRVQANYAFAYALTAISVQLSNNGLLEYSGPDQKPVPLAKLQLLRADLEAAGGDAIEALLEWLEVNREVVPEWVESDACTYHAGQFVATAREFQEHVDIDRSRRRFLQLRPALRQAEEMALRPVLGRPLLKAIKAELTAGSLSDQTKELLDDYIRPGLCNLAIGYDRKDPDRVANGAAYLEELRLYLVEHADDFPLFVRPETALPFANSDDTRFFAAF